MQQLTDPYRALGVARGATDAEIKAAHRKLAKRYHPDSGSKSEPERFLRVQEAYRLLSDPLLRKEWDLKHAPGPIRADRPTTAPPPRRRRPPPSTPRPEAEPAETAPPRPSAKDADPRTQPRSSRAYTWSASEVPWWEESRDKKQSAKEKQQAGSTPPGAPTPGATPPGSTPPSGPEQPTFGQQDFDVYNRSSGAAWSSAARAYFRKGEQELPRRGSFRHQGTQVVTAGRARAAAEAEARHRAAAASAAAAAQAQADVYASARTQASTAPGPREGTTHIVRRAVAAPWPTLLQRFGFAVVAWVPIAAFVAFASQASGDELMGLALSAASLVALLTFPRIAYIAALATVLALVIGGLFLGGILLSGSHPSVDRLLFYVGALLMVGYAATAVAVVLGPASLRPWSAR